jgi:hypothetical protein
MKQDDVMLFALAVFVTLVLIGSVLALQFVSGAVAR